VSKVYDVQQRRLIQLDTKLETAYACAKFDYCFYEKSSNLIFMIKSSTYTSNAYFSKKKRIINYSHRQKVFNLSVIYQELCLKLLLSFSVLLIKNFFFFFFFLSSITSLNFFRFHAPFHLTYSNFFPLFIFSSYVFFYIFWGILKILSSIFLFSIYVYKTLHLILSSRSIQKGLCLLSFV
jgi:hypothetical protein